MVLAPGGIDRAVERLGRVADLVVVVERLADEVDRRDGCLRGLAADELDEAVALRARDARALALAAADVLAQRCHLEQREDELVGDDARAAVLGRHVAPRRGDVKQGEGSRGGIRIRGGGMLSRAG
jgi:hypothetical protein